MFVIFICNSQNIRRYSTMQIGRDSLFKPHRIRNEQRIFMPEIRFKLMQNSRLNSDLIIYLVKLIIHLYNLCKLNGLIINFEIGVFDDVRLEVCIRPLQCYVACSNCDGKNRERCIIPILPVNVSRSYRDNASLVSTIFSNFFEFLKIKQMDSSKHYQP